MNDTLRNAAVGFAKALKQQDRVQSYLKAQELFENDEKIAALRREYGELVQAYHRKQAAGELQDEDLQQVKSMQKDLNQHPITTDYLTSRNSLVEELRVHNQQMGALLGFDFAASSGSSSCCG